jgi:hypothetical protein
MNLSELAFSCFCYSRLTTNYDGSYLLFLQATQPSIDLNKSDHRRALLKWLNQWGCRQFAIDYHDHASQKLLQWHNEFGDRMPLVNKNIWELTDEDYKFIHTAYNSLVNCIASLRHRNGTEIRVSFGPTGAAKILFAIRPNAFAPWDAPIRHSFQYDGSADSYVCFLKKVNQELQQIKPTCEANGFSLTELPTRLYRKSSVPKLIDEYYYSKRLSKEYLSINRQDYLKLLASGDMISIKEEL